MTTVTIIHPDTGDKIKVSPMAINIPMGELNENLQHVAQTCQATLVYEPELLELFALKTNISATVENEFGTLFTGLIDTSVTWTDNGLPTPIDAIQVKIHDNTRLLDRQTTDEVALINTTVAAAVRRICTDCGVQIKEGAKLPLATLTAFVLDAGTSYLQSLNNLLFQHEAAFVFTPDGELDVIKFGEIPDNLPLLGPDKILTGFSPTRTPKKYDAVKIGYTTITKQSDQQVYFEGNGLGEDNKIIPITIRPGQYYPYESDPVQETREGQVYQEFANGYAESYQAYNGEQKFRRSQKTALLYTANHRLVQDWQGSLVVDRTDYQARRSSVRLQNTGAADAKIMQLAIRADAWYREPVSYVTFGTGSEYVYEGEYLYTAEAAEKLAGTLSRFFRGGNYKLSGRTTHKLTPGQFLRVDSGISGFTANALVLSCSHDPDTDLYSVQLITYGDIAIDIHRYKAQASRGDANSHLLSTLLTETEIMPPPDKPVDVTTRADGAAITIQWRKFSNEAKNNISRYEVIIDRGNGSTTLASTTMQELTYAFHRPTDGYPEAADLAEWRVRVKAVNIYGKESTWSDEEAIDTSGYLTWQVVAPRARAKAERDWIDWSWPEANKDVYGTIVYDLMAGDRVLATASTNTYRYRFDRQLDGYPEKSDLLAMGLKVRARNDATSAEYRLEELDIDLKDYKTWIPQVVAVRAEAEETQIGIEWDKQTDVYGSFSYDIIVNGREDGRTTAHYHPYEFNRLRDGYPEKDDLDGWKNKLVIANEANRLEVPFAIDTSRYKTWIPQVHSFSVTAEADYIRTEWTDNQADCYGVLRYTIKRDGQAIRTDIRQSPLNIAYNRQVDGYPEKDWFTHQYTVTAYNEAHKVESAQVEADTTDYRTWRIAPPSVTARAREGAIDFAWGGKPSKDSPDYYYGTPQYTLSVDGAEAAASLDGTVFTYQFSPEVKGWPEASDIAAWAVTLTVETEAGSVDVPVTVDVSDYKGYTPKGKPIAQASANGRLVNASWQRDTSVYGYTGADVQVAKAYKVVDGQYTPIVDESELVWMKPALGQNPYVSEDNYQDGAGSLFVNREQVSLLVPLFGQAIAPEPETMYAYRVATRTVKGIGPWSKPIYVIARPVSASDVVRAWRIEDTGEKVKVDGAIGANQIFVHDLAAISANLGLITDGMIAGSELNYWAINDVVDEQGRISRFRGEWRVGDEEEYILVSVKRDEDGNPIPGRFSIKLAAGEYVVFAGDTEIHGKTFTFYDTEDNIIFQITPQSSYIAVRTGSFVANFAKTTITGLPPYAYIHGAFVTRRNGKTIYRRLYQDRHGVSRVGFFIIEKGEDRLMEQLPSTIPGNINCFESGNSLYTVQDNLAGLDYTSYRYCLLDGSGTVFPDTQLGYADYSMQGFFTPDRASGWRRVSFVEKERYAESFMPTGDGHLFYVRDEKIEVIDALKGTITSREGINVKSARYVGNHYILGLSDSGDRVWSLLDSSYFDLQLEQNDSPLYVQAPDNIWATDAEGRVWHHDASGRTETPLVISDFTYIVAETYGVEVWLYQQDGTTKKLTRLNVLDGSYEEAELPDAKYSFTMTTASYIVLQTEIHTVLVEKRRLTRQTTITQGGLWAFMPGGGDLLVQINIMYNQAWVQLSAGDDGNPTATWLDPPIHAGDYRITNHDIDLDTMTWRRNTFVVPSQKYISPIWGLSDNGRRIWLTEGGLSEQEGDTLINLGTPLFDRDAVSSRDPLWRAHRGYIYIVKEGTLGCIVTRVNQATLHTSYAGLPLTQDYPGENGFVVQEGWLWMARKGNIIINNQSALFPEERPLLVGVELAGMAWSDTLESAQYSMVELWDTGDFEYGLIEAGGDGSFLAAAGLREGDSMPSAGLLRGVASDNPTETAMARYHGQAEVIKTEVDMLPFGANGLVQDGVATIAGYQPSLDTRTNSYIIGQVNISAKETTSSREVYETGVGFKSVLFDGLSGHYRYLMDTGACIEFDEDGNLISHGEKGAPGRDGSPGTPGAKGAGIQSTTPYYLASSQSSGVSTGTAGWTTTAQSTTASKRYLWNYLRFTYTDGTVVETNPVIIGTQGEKGVAGSGLEGLETRRFQKPDNNGAAAWLVTHDITDLFTVSTPTSGSMTTRGFAGTIISARENMGFNLNISPQQLFMTATYRPVNNAIQLRSSHEGYKPHIIQADGKYYLALRVTGSARSLYLFGRFSDGKIYNAATGSYSGESSYMGTWLETTTDGSLPAGYSIVEDYQPKMWQWQEEIGTLSALNTSAKDSLVAAVNEVQAEVNSANSTANTNKASIGTLSALNTSAKDSLVAAVNEVQAEVNNRTAWHSTTMLGGGFVSAAGGYISLQDFWTKLVEKFGRRAEVFFPWSSASAGYVSLDGTANTNRVSLSGSTVIYNCNNTPNTDWAVFHALVIPGGSITDSYIITARTSQTAGTLSSKRIYTIGGLSIKDTVYVQFRGEKSPQELFGGTWENISNQHAGRFFRAEGGSAASFGSQQDDAIKSHNHSISLRVNWQNAYESPPYHVSGREHTFLGYYYATTDYTGGSETRPINETMRIWKRTG